MQIPSPLRQHTGEATLLKLLKRMGLGRKFSEAESVMAMRKGSDVHATERHLCPKQIFVNGLITS